MTADGACIRMTAEEARIRLAANPATAAETLMELARDASLLVRASLAVNPALPAALRDMLAGDPDPRVRAIIAHRIGQNGASGNVRPEHAAPAEPAPGTEAQGRSPAGQADRPAAGVDAGDAHTPAAELLSRLADRIAHAGPGPRRRVSELVCNLAEGPRELILDLAQDAFMPVAEPVILFSPLLTDDDLLVLVARAPCIATLHAIARRAAIGAAVCDALVESGDNAVIEALLRNQTAQIREATLDALALQAEDNPEWQEALVARPALSARASRVLGEFLAGPLLQSLRDRADLDPAVARDLRAAQAGELELDPPLEPALGLPPASALSRAAALMASGALDGGAIIEALRRSETMQAMALLAVKADVALPVVERARMIRSAKAIVSLCWKAGLGMRTAILVQSGLARLPPHAILRPARDGGWPLSAEAMEAELAALSSANGGLRAWIPRRLDPEAVARDLVRLGA